MAKTVTIGNANTKHLVVSTDKFLSPLCGAVHPGVGEDAGKRRSVRGDVTCENCKKVFKRAVTNVLA